MPVDEPRESERQPWVTGPARGDRRTSPPRPVVVAIVVGIVLAVVKGAYVGTGEPGGSQTLILHAALVVGAVVIGAVAGRVGGLAAAGLRPRVAWRSAVPPAAVAVVVGLTAAVALSPAGPSEATRIVVATALGEEILFRGVVYRLAATASVRAAIVVSSVSFGAWHVVDAVEAAGGDLSLVGALALVAGVVLLTGAAGAVMWPG